MEGIVALLLVVGCVLVLPLVALSKAQSANRRAKECEAMLALAEQRAVQAARHAAEVDARLSAWVAYFQGLVVPPRAASPCSTQPSDDTPTAESADDGLLSPGLDDEITAASRAASLSIAPDEGRSELGVTAGPQTPIENASATVISAADTPETPTSVATPTVPGERGAQRPSYPPAAAHQTPSAVVTPKSDAAGFDWERLVGVRLFAWLGGGALFLAAALFLQFSIQHNLVSPEVRVGTGLLLGALALFGGDRLRARTPLAGNALCGSGVAILYAALYAAHGLYGLIGIVPAFTGMAVVTLTAGLMAVHQNAYFVALLGLLGGMTTPYLLSTGEDRPVSLFLYVAALSAGIATVASRQGWPSLGLLGLLGASFLFVGWSSQFLDAPRSGYALFAFTAVVVIYAVLRRGARARSAFALELAVGAGTIFLPLLAALAISVEHRLALPPLTLAAHLLAVSGLTWFVASRDSLPLGPVAAGFTVLVWLLRCDAQLLRTDAVLTCCCMALVPLAHFGVWFWRRRDASAQALYPTLLVALVGAAPLGIATRLTYSELSFSVGLLYVASHAAISVVVGALAGRGVPLALAQLVMLATLGACGWSEAVTLNQRTAIALIGSGLFFYALPLANRRLRVDSIAWVSAILALPLHYVLLYGCIRESWGDAMVGTLALVAAALLITMLAIVRNWTAEAINSVRLRALLGGAALGFLTTAIPILLSNEWLTVSWALEVLAVCWLYRRVADRGLLWFAWALAVGVGIRLLLNPALWLYHPRAATRLLNHYLYTFGVPVAAFFAAARLIQHDSFARKLRLPAALGLLGTVFLFMLLNVEVADYFSTGQTLTFNWSGGGSLAEDMTYSLAWGGFGIGLLVAGLLLGNRAVRIGALLVLVLTIGKVFLHDLWELGSLYRVGSIVGLALALLGVSYLTQRFILAKENS